MALQNASLGKSEAVERTLSRLKVDLDGSLDYEKFQTWCVELFGRQETKEHEWRVREIFDLFDANADGVLRHQELSR